VPLSDVGLLSRRGRPRPVEHRRRMHARGPRTAVSHPWAIAFSGHTSLLGRAATVRRERPPPCKPLPDGRGSLGECDRPDSQPVERVTFPPEPIPACIFGSAGIQADRTWRGSVILLRRSSTSFARRRSSWAMGRESQACGADLAERGIESAEETAQTPPSVAERRELRAAAARARGSVWANDFVQTRTTDGTGQMG